MRKAPKLQTVKKLFALSGNICAFPSCTNSIVDDRDNLNGQICHIEAAEEGGQRFNIGQTDDERASFENLILLCAHHHIVTNDEGIYTVEKLHKMKRSHEKRFVKAEYVVSKEILDKAIEKVVNIQANSNTGSGQQINNQAEKIVIKQGMTAEDVVAIANSLYEANFPRLVAASKEEASKNVSKFKKKFKEDLVRMLSAQEIEKFADPDIQVGLCNAIRASAVKDSSELRELLSGLVIKRVKNDSNDLKQKVLNEAISTVNKITLAQMNILVICFLFKHTMKHGMNSWEEFKKYLETDVMPFIDFKSTRAEIFHLQYAGCGKVEEVFTFNLAEHLRLKYSFFFLKGFEVGELDVLGLGEDVKNKILRTDSVSKKVFFNAIDKDVLKDFLTKEGVHEYIVEKAISLYESNLMSVEESQEKINKDMPWMKDVFRKFMDTSLNHLSLTSVGQAIAISYFEQRTASSLDMDTWIN